MNRLLNSTKLANERIPFIYSRGTPCLNTCTVPTRSTVFHCRSKHIIQRKIANFPKNHGPIVRETVHRYSKLDFSHFPPNFPRNFTDKTKFSRDSPFLWQIDARTTEVEKDKVGFTLARKLRFWQPVDSAIVDFSWATFDEVGVCNGWAMLFPEKRFDRNRFP